MSDYQYNPNVEQWKDIPGFPGYQVSDHGRVRSFKKKYVRVLKPQLTGPERNYQKVSLGKNIPKFIHRLVLETFVGPCPDGMETCHYDGNTRNNYLPNLRWDTHLGNQVDRIRHGTTRRGLLNNMTKLTDGQVLELRHLYAQGVKTSALMDKYGIGRVQVCRIANGDRRPHLGGPTNISSIDERHPKGGDHPNAKLTNAQVIELRHKAANGIPNRTLATEYEISIITVQQIVRRASWKHL